jgi:hypothetical protein
MSHAICSLESSSALDRARFYLNIDISSQNEPDLMFPKFVR